MRYTEYMANTIFEKFNVAELSPQQVINLNILENFVQAGLQRPDTSVAIIEGAAGTGKSVLLTELFRRLQRGTKQVDSSYAGTHNVFTVNHPELLKVYQGMTAKIPELRQKDYMRPTSLINQLDKTNSQADIVVIDEGHLLLSKSEPYIKFTQDNQLAEIIKRAKVVVAVFDFDQVMQSKMMWTEELLSKQLEGSHIQRLNLDYQHRVQAPAEVQDWLNQLGQGELHHVPIDTDGYDIKLLDSAGEMFELIKEKDQSNGLSRIVATTGFPRRNLTEHNVYLDTFDQPWDEYDPQKTPWAERPESINEVGSIYTVQGFDLNYVGVILSPAYEYNADTDSIIVNTNKVTHREIYKKRSDVTDQQEIARLEQAYMMNTLHVLITRGIKGLYLTAADDALRKRLQELRRP